MQWDLGVVGWAIVALILFAGEALAPGAFMLWLGFAATAVFILTLVFPEMSLLVQVIAFIALSFISIEIYRRRFRGRERQSDQPALNRRTDQLVGRVVVLEKPIVQGVGRVQIADAFWEVIGPELPAGTPVRIVGSEGMSLKVEPVA
ncbi:MAG: NfeD family protein [Pseudomonadota bacterium]|nr:NfeD family protein [Pseudomonadota bacterium]